MINEFRLPECIYEEIYADGEKCGSYCCKEKSRLLLRLFIPRGYKTLSIKIRIYGDGGRGRTLYTAEGVFEYAMGDRDVYSFYIPREFTANAGIFFYDYFRTAYDCESAEFSTGGGDLKDGNGLGQMLVVRPDMMRKSYIPAIYHVFVDRFNRAGNEKPKKYAQMCKPEDEIPEYSKYPGYHIDNEYFYGGDLDGVTEKLPYIESLGVSLIYLSPVFEARSNHKYDTGDYSKVDPMFGGEEALSRLITEAKKRGIGVILDGVFNHTGADSIYFDRYSNYGGNGAYSSPTSKYRDWYSFSEYPDKYDSWWGIRSLPRIRPGCEGFRRFITGEGGIIEKYMQMGIAGWRLDVADELTDDFINALKDRVSSVSPDGIVYGEVWENATNKEAYGVRRRYIEGGMLDSVMDYPIRTAVKEYIRNGEAERFSATVADIMGKYPPRASSMLMNSLGTHDTARILTELAGKRAGELTPEERCAERLTASEKKHGLALVRLAYLLISALPGAPCIYYGDEAGMEGYGDPFNRRYYPWGKEDKETVDFYSAVGKMR
ncbi:MAG: glycoside hydrolase family 13 protein, partial [Clostridia bacterium]|nr:glycoside hydrolase family 13 protein [Clostridia bacterium]